MSDIMINICSSDDTSHRSQPTSKERRKSNQIQKKIKRVVAKDCLKDKQNNFYKKSSRKDQNPQILDSCSNESVKTKATDPIPSVSGSLNPAPVVNPSKYLAIDCEMVGTGPKGNISQLARCSIVTYDGDVVYDEYIKPPMHVTDYRTRWSGIRPRHLIHATPFLEARKEILRLLMGKVVVGHAIYNDFKVLCYTHPSTLTRDTSRIPLLKLKAGISEKGGGSLKHLTKAILNRDIQVGKKGHSSVEDAIATMDLYKVVAEEWERVLLSKSLAT